MAAVLAAAPLAAGSPARADFIFSQINVPGASQTFASGINDAGQIVGTYSLIGNDIESFLATSPATAVAEPAGLTLLGVSLAGFGVIRRRATLSSGGQSAFSAVDPEKPRLQPRPWI